MIKYIMKKLIYIAIPPHKGIGPLCFFRLVGLSVNPTFIDIFINTGIKRKDIINAPPSAIK